MTSEILPLLCFSVVERSDLLGGSALGSSSSQVLFRLVPVGDARIASVSVSSGGERPLTTVVIGETAVEGEVVSGVMTRDSRVPDSRKKWNRNS